MFSAQCSSAKLANICMLRSSRSKTVVSGLPSTSVPPMRSWNSRNNLSTAMLASLAEETAASQGEAAPAAVPARPVSNARRGIRDEGKARGLVMRGCPSRGRVCVRSVSGVTRGGRGNLSQEETDGRIDARTIEFSRLVPMFAKLIGRGRWHPEGVPSYAEGE